MEVLAKRLKWLREKKRLAQKEVAIEIGMKTVNGYQKIEMDERNPKLETLVRLAELFEVSTDFLLGLSDKNSEIKEIENELFELNTRLTVIESEFTLHSHKAISLKNDLNEKKKGKLHDLTYDFKSKELEIIEDMRNKLENELYKLRNEFGSQLFTYIVALLELPGSDPSKDSTIKKFLPIEIKIKETLYDIYYLDFYVAKFDFVGSFGTFYSYEDAENKRIEILKRIYVK
ncbi:helix-turn-helix domain-containing protein [Metabacillus sp. Hm71]|uniref:helix-turn-helix domain-containing protein n=1 Tax=Metabacillus sp. Hm71 TaxID=3450743 RepID=UPI003F4289A9